MSISYEYVIYNSVDLQEVQDQMNRWGEQGYQVVQFTSEPVELVDPHYESLTMKKGILYVVVMQKSTEEVNYGKGIRS